MEKMRYEKPTIESEKAFDVSMSGVSLFAQCYGVGVKSQTPNCKS